MPASELLPDGCPLRMPVRLLGLISQGLVGFLVRGRRRARAADSGGCSMARLHGRITTAMSYLSPARNAEVVCVSRRRGDHEKHRCEQCSARRGKRLRSRCHLTVLLLLQVGRNCLQKIPKRVRAPGFMIAELSGESCFAIVAIRIAAMPMRFGDLKILSQEAGAQIAQYKLENDQVVCAGCRSTLYAREDEFAVNPAAASRFGNDG